MEATPCTRCDALESMGWDESWKPICKDCYRDLRPYTPDGTIARRGSTILGRDPNGGPGGCYPLCPYYVRLPSGLRHWFESWGAAEKSQYWTGAR